MLPDWYEETCFEVVDKHGLKWLVYNAKMNIYREGREPIFLGLQEQDAASGQVQRLILPLYNI